MNLILIEPGEIGPDGTVLLTGRRAAHARGVLRVSVGQMLKTGETNGPAGVSRVLAVTDAGVLLQPTHDQPTKMPWFDLILATPRPKTLKRLLPQLTELGVGRIVLLKAQRVEACYFGTHWLEVEHYRPLLLEGLAQSGRTRLPELLVRTRFKAFALEELDEAFPETRRLLAHPGPRTALMTDAAGASRRPLLAVGPEGGWAEDELLLLERRGFCRFSLGEQTLRTDTACVALAAALEWELARAAAFRLD